MGCTEDFNCIGNIFFLKLESRYFLYLKYFIVKKEKTKLLQFLSFFRIQKMTALEYPDLEVRILQLLLEK